MLSTLDMATYKLRKSKAHKIPYKLYPSADKKYMYSIFIPSKKNNKFLVCVDFGTVDQLLLRADTVAMYEWRLKVFMRYKPSLDDEYSPLYWTYNVLLHPTIDDPNKALADHLWVKYGIAADKKQ